MNSQLTTITSIGLALLIPLSSAPIACAQNDDDEEIFELSPFMVDASGDRGHRSSRKLSNNTTPLEIIESGSSIKGIKIGDYSRFGPEVGVKLRFAIGFYDDEEKVRRDTLNRYLDQIAADLASESDLTFETGKILVPEGDRSRSKSRKRSDFASFAHFTLTFASDQVKSPFERVRAIRRLVGETNFDSKYAKVFYGNAHLTPLSHELVGQSKQLNAVITGIATGGNAPIQIAFPNVPIMHIEKAEAVEFNVSLESKSDQETEAQIALDTFFNSISNSIARYSGSNYGPRYTKITPLKRIKSKASIYQIAASANVTLKIDDSKSTNSQVLELKRSILESNANIEAAKIEFTPPRFVVENPDKYRAEILKKIAADVSLIDETLGADFTVDLSIQSSRVLVWQHSATEVAFWLPYNTTIVSQRQRAQEELRLTRQHEIAMKDTRSQIVCCGNATEIKR
ncbi:MAG: hypothetical protein AAGB46_07400 [Verrucomicrobiota bacterium]